MSVDPKGEGAVCQGCGGPLSCPACDPAVLKAGMELLRVQRALDELRAQIAKDAGRAKRCQDLIRGVALLGEVLQPAFVECLPRATKEGPVFRLIVSLRSRVQEASDLLLT